MLRRLSFVFPLAVAAAFGCGSVSNRNDTSIATVSGTLSGDVPAGARVAIVWHAPKGGAWVVSNEAPVVGGAFSINLTGAPADDLFFDPNESGINGGGALPPDAPRASPEPAPSTGGSAGGSSSGFNGGNVRTKDVVSGSVGTPMQAAIAGFVLYVDKNGNNALDVSGNGESPDEIVGGSHELVLTYLRDGTNLDYEKLRDDTQQLPSRGYNLFFTARNRWLSLSSVGLTLGDDRLPSPVCYVGDEGNVSYDDSTPAYPGSSSSGSSGTVGVDAGAPSGYPDPGDPNLRCAPDGRSFSYESCSPPPPPPPPTPKTLCSDGDITVSAGGCGGYGAVLPPDGSIPPGWPCPVSGDVDGGPAPSADASAPVDAGKGP